MTLLCLKEKPANQINKQIFVYVHLKVQKNLKFEMFIYLTNFSNPTPKVDSVVTTQWIPMTGTQDSCLVIDRDLKMKFEIYPQRMKVFKEIYGKKLHTLN